MSKQLKIKTYSPDQTYELGNIIGKHIKSGIIIALTGDLGSGKTVFVQGLARGLEVSDKYYITSPTYTLINEYPGKLPFFHIDLYRLKKDVDFEDIGLEEVLYGDGVAAIEWAQQLHKTALDEHIAVSIDILSDKSRNISIFAYGFKENNLICEVEKIIKERLWG